LECSQAVSLSETSRSGQLLSVRSFELVVEG
jgi:hypothetical protein